MLYVDYIIFNEISSKNPLTPPPHHPPRVGPGPGPGPGRARARPGPGPAGAPLFDILLTLYIYYYNGAGRHRHCTRKTVKKTGWRVTKQYGRKNARKCTVAFRVYVFLCCDIGRRALIFSTRRVGPNVACDISQHRLRFNVVNETCSPLFTSLILKKRMRRS